MERDDLIQQRVELTRRLESNECLLKEKEDEVFLQLERVVYLEEQCDKVSGTCLWYFLTLNFLMSQLAIYSHELIKKFIQTSFNLNNNTDNFYC